MHSADLETIARMWLDTLPLKEGQRSRQAIVEDIQHWAKWDHMTAEDQEIVDRAVLIITAPNYRPSMTPPTYRHYLASEIE